MCVFQGIFEKAEIKSTQGLTPQLKVKEPAIKGKKYIDQSSSNQHINSEDLVIRNYVKMYI